MGRLFFSQNTGYLCGITCDTLLACITCHRSKRDARLGQQSLSPWRCILDPSAKVAHSEAVTTLVRFKPLSEQEIEGYIRTGEPFGKAGSYAIQGVGSFMVEAINGSYTNVVGLPLCAVIKALVSVGGLECFPLAEDLRQDNARSH